MDRVPPLSSQSLDGTGLPTVLLDQGTQELQKFATLTYKGLLEREENLLKAPGRSDLRVFCRLDLGIYLNNQGDYQWFVNEIASSARAGLFLKSLDRGSSRIGMDFAFALKEWVIQCHSH